MFSSCALNAEHIIKFNLKIKYREQEMAGSCTTALLAMLQRKKVFLPRKIFLR